ncbi:hypothetical protein PCAR4_150200 [Paraburkholderia caribensis]|nr:hypothetical protein PCAR4_150200 [Paraburkholderia caribensis]
MAMTGSERLSSLAVDGRRRRIQFLIQHALLVAREAAAVLAGHVVRFVADRIEPVMQRGAFGRRITALAHARVDIPAHIVDAAVDLFEAVHGQFVRIRRVTWLGKLSRRWGHACGERRN